MIPKIKFVIVLASIFNFQTISSQSIEILGKVQSKLDVENINIINKTAQVFTISDVNGEFTISVKLNDTILFSSIQHKTKTIIVDKYMILFKALRVFLEEQVNVLDEVIVGKVLTGDLMSDIGNVKGDPPINFYDVGIPGYTGKPATQSERRLSEASKFNPKAGGSLGGVGGSLSLNPLINAITGRTKMLKNRVEIEEKDELLHGIKARLSKDFLMSNPLEDDLVMDFFYFCADDENFIKYCKNQSDFKILIFLRMKYKKYLDNLNTNKD